MRIPSNTATKQERRHTAIILGLFGPAILICSIIGLAADHMAIIVLSGIAFGLVLWIGLMHLFQPKA